MTPELLTPLGFVSYYLWIMGEMNAAGQPVNPIKFILARPYKSLLSLIFAYLGYTLVTIGLDPEVGSETLVLALLTYLATLSGGIFVVPKTISPALLQFVFMTSSFMAGFLPFLVADKLGKKYAK